MDIPKLTPTEWVMLGSAIGLIFGLIPLITGFIKNNRKMGVYGFLSSGVGGAVLGIYLAVPVAAIFTWLIIREPKNPIETVVNEKPIDATIGQRDDQ
jgi:hypothetical protein